VLDFESSIETMDFGADIIVNNGHVGDSIKYIVTGISRPRR